MPKSQRETLKGHAKAVQERLKKLKSGSSSPTNDAKKSSKNVNKEDLSKNIKKT